jgi:taurine dioxygenase/putative 2-oxoglutarate oxygenase
MKVTPFENGFGADISDIPPTMQVSDADLNGIVAAWHKHSILRFRGLDMTPEQHIAFTRRLGPTHVMQPLSANLEGYPEVFVISNASKEDPSKPVEKGGTAAGQMRVGEGFHTDGEDKAIPNAGSMLYAKVCPPERGDTLWVDVDADRKLSHFLV